MQPVFLHEFFKKGTFTENEMEYIISKHHKIEISKNDFLFKTGQIISSIYLVESGIARSYLVNFAKEEVTTHFFCKHEIVVDEISFLEKIPTVSNYQAITNMRVWEINIKSFYQLFDEIPEFRLWVRNRIISALIKEKQTNLWMKTKAAHDRYKDMINANPDFNYYVPLKYIATYLGIIPR